MSESGLSQPEAGIELATSELTDEEREVFESLAERYDGEALGRLCAHLAQSSSKEDANV